MPIFAVFAANLQNFEWIGEAPSVHAAIAALYVELSEIAFDPSEFQGLRVYTVDQEQADALIDWCGSRSGEPDDLDGFPANLPAPIGVSHEDLTSVFQQAKELASTAVRL